MPHKKEDPNPGAQKEHRSDLRQYRAAAVYVMLLAAAAQETGFKRMTADIVWGRGRSRYGWVYLI